MPPLESVGNTPLSVRLSVKKRRKASEPLVAVRRVFVELLVEERERLAREGGPKLENVDCLKRCMYGSGRQCSLASALRADLERTWLRPKSQTDCEHRY